MLYTLKFVIECEVEGDTEEDARELFAELVKEASIEPRDAELVGTRPSEDDEEKSVE